MLFRSADLDHVTFSATLKITRRDSLMVPGNTTLKEEIDDIKTKLAALETKEDNKITELQNAIDTINEHFNNLIWFFEGDYTGNFYPKINDQRIHKSEYVMFITKKAGNAFVSETSDGYLFIDIEYTERVSFVVMKYK